ncbi:chloramphenicol-sensitive protein RarD [Friedmanniella endophytica]|uniref:Chloramphenicol-sensitive protein RarD n=1 Tax=Microlunatus kandeliicorticis TaxID=1759536 RepID=A0A7W3P4D5_9ACTN|nr:EamA family transporter RarD [Microlunatus kandeliicorticis]MBA8792809.1 chloramphenicol-sensitive protein RarD [Microlunatus kandeliicorticis]
MADRSSRGIAYGLGAYGIWGLVPLFWRLVESAGALEILASRVVWSLVFAVITAAVALPRRWFRPLANRRSLLLLGVAAVLISVNWGVYIWATNHDHVTETALGYYVNPIVSIVLGVLVLRERLARWQWVAVGLALVAVVVLTVDYGRPPWISLTLALSFGGYGLIKNRVNGGALQTLVVESAFLFLPALGYLVFLESRGRLTFGHQGWAHSLLLVAGGLVTLIPLILFSAAATRLPLSVIGLLQYVTPTCQFLLGVLWFGEAMSTGRWIGFGIVWLALVVLTVGSLTAARRRRRAPLEVPEPV